MSDSTVYKGRQLSPGLNEADSLTLERERKRKEALRGLMWTDGILRKIIPAKRAEDVSND